jgi:hypothetical protein
VTFLRAYAYLVPPMLLLGLTLALAFDLGLGLWTVVLLTLVICALAAAAICRFSHNVGTFASRVYTGSGHFTAKEQHAGNITRARYFKTQGCHEEALAVIDEYLDHVPGEPEGLFLKAQILMASEGDLSLARRCLDAVIKYAPADDPFHQWAKESLKSLSDRSRPI